MGKEIPDWYGPNLERINSFSELKDNWDGEDAHSINQEIIVASLKFLKFLCYLCPKERPYVFPTLGGTILFEWFSNENGIGCGEIEITGEDSCEFYID